MSLKMDLVCFSHLRWNFVFQRPQHLLTRFSKEMRVFFIEEPFYDDGPEQLEVTKGGDNLWVVIPHLKAGLSEQESNAKRKQQIEKLFIDMNISNYIFWYYTPMSLNFTDQFKPALTVYDCMDELSAFKFAPAGLKESEERLFKKADLVFTGGYSLYEAKRNRHQAVYPFPSSIDKAHFQQARTNQQDPQDQQTIPHPRFGFYGVVDERFDIDIIAQVAERKPEWHFVIIGPVVKIDPEILPKNKNIHYLGGKSYNELPAYLSGWDIAIIPFALNESTKFISPTKTPEYLSAGKPVISSSIRDVVSPYAEKQLVRIADNADDFISAAEKELAVTDRQSWLSEVDEFLKENSWNNTWNQMMQLIKSKLAQKTEDNKNINLNLKENIYV
jgi:glycosyltransferase involved in cell wall biosynthesis